MKMGRSRFQHKLIGYNILVFMLIFLIVAGSFFYYMISDLTQQANQDFETLANKTAMQFNTLVYNMDKTAVQIAANPNVVSWFFHIPQEHQGNYFVEEPVVASEVVLLLNSYNFKKDGNSRILLYNDQGDWVYSATTMTTTRPIAAYLNSDAFHEIQSYFQTGSVYSYFRAPHPDDMNDSGLPSPGYFSIVRQIKDYSQNSSQCGYVEVQQSEAQIDAIFGDMGAGCYAALYNKSGQMVYQSNALQSADAAIQTAFAELPAETLEKDGLSGNGSLRWWCGGIEEAPVRVVCLMETRTLYRSLFRFGIVLMAVLVATMTVAIVSEVLLSRHLSRPLLELQDSIKNVNLKKLQLDLKNDTDSDELQQLKLTFNQMTEQLGLAIDRQLASETNELKSHLFALQSQMNPHFIYNLLAIISMEATADDNQKIITICSSLSKMLSFSSSMGDGCCTMQAEMKHAENYLQLMKARYEDRFEYEIRLPRELWEHSVPKLVIQPLCENSFEHGFKHCRPVWRLRIEATGDANAWSVSVTDNGPGFSTEYLRQHEEFVQAATVENVRNVLERLTIGGMGLANIYMRMKLAYGENAVFRVENTANGARVTLGRRSSDDKGIGCGG